jgi:hypothetical protein
MMAVRLTRIGLIGLGCLVIGWGTITTPIFWQNAPVEQVAANVLRRVAYKPEALQTALPVVEDLERSSDCAPPRALQGSAIIRLRLMEDAFSADQMSQLDARIEAADKSIRRSLECSPADPFLWMVLSPVESLRDGLRPEFLGYLAASYRLGPREGWIAVQRNRVALAIFPMLPPDLAASAVREFTELVANRLYEAPADVLLGPSGANIRDKLLASLQSVPERERNDFAIYLRSRGSDLSIPGVASSGARPWQ